MRRKRKQQRKFHDAERFQQNISWTLHEPNNRNPGTPNSEQLEELATIVMSKITNS